MVELAEVTRAPTLSKSITFPSSHYRQGHTGCYHTPCTSTWCICRCMYIHVYVCVQVRGQPQVLFLRCIYLVFSNRVSQWDLELTN